MRNDEPIKNPLHIGRYIFWRFFVLMICIYFANAIIDILFRKYVWDFVISVFKIDNIIFNGSGLAYNLKLLFAIFLAMLPFKVPFIKALALDPVISAMDIEIYAPAEIMEKGNLAVSTYYVLLIAVILILLLITLLPYIGGSIWFALIIRDKMNELRQYDKDRAREYEQKRNLLLSDIAHDIKTPITTMSGYAKALNDELVSDEQKKEYLETIYRKSMRVSELINMMFEYIKIDSAEYALNLEDADLAELVRQTVADLYSDCENAGLILDADIPEAECICNMDSLQISRVITNLLSNAVKYLCEGDSIMVRMNILPNSRDNKKHYEIIVEDNGEQIPDELAEDIFSPFTRGDKARNTKGGNGLGLSIAFKIIQLHGGELILDREPKDSSYTKAFVISL